MAHVNQLPQCYAPKHDRHQHIIIHDQTGFLKSPSRKNDVLKHLEHFYFADETGETLEDISFEIREDSGYEAQSMNVYITNHPNFKAFISSDPLMSYCYLKVSKKAMKI